MQVMCKCVHILRDCFCTAIEEVVRQYGRNRHKQADSSRYQSLANRTGYRSNAHLTAFADADQGMVNTPNSTQQADKRSGCADGGQRGQP